MAKALQDMTPNKSLATNVGHNVFFSSSERGLLLKKQTESVSCVAAFLKKVKEQPDSFGAKLDDFAKKVMECGQKSQAQYEADLKVHGNAFERIKFLILNQKIKIIEITENTVGKAWDLKTYDDYVKRLSNIKTQSLL